MLDGLPQKPARQAAKAAPTLAAYLPEFWRDCGGHWKPSTFATNRRYAECEPVPVFGNLPLDAIAKADLLRWRDDLSQRTGVFNRALPVLGGLLSYAERLGYRRKGSNPCKGIARYKRELPERFLSEGEYRRLWRVLADWNEDQPFAVAAIKLLVLTGARSGEITGLRWDYVQGERLVLPESKTGPKIVWVNTAARAVLEDVPERSVARPIFPPRRAGTAFNITPYWLRIRRAAPLPDVRLHDLRHSFASVAISDGISLATIGKLLGHFLPETTARYAHLADEVIADAAERVCGGLAAALEGRA
jgi:integrase